VAGIFKVVAGIFNVVAGIEKAFFFRILAKRY
jgi:hypothetical protein